MQKEASRRNHTQSVLNQMLLVHQYVRLPSMFWKPWLANCLGTDSFWHEHLHSQHRRDWCLVLMLSFKKWLVKSLRRVLSLQKIVLDFLLTKGSDDFDNRVDMSKPSRGCSEDFKSFVSVSLLHEVCSSCFGFNLDLFLKSYFDIHLLLI
jgi:hypothetical protein